jgi:hypothetical protein
MYTDSLRRPLVAGGIALLTVVAGWCASCSSPAPTQGDAATRFATKDTAIPSNYPVALPSNWQAYQNPSTAPSTMPADWPPSNLSSLPMSWPGGYSPTGGVSGPVDTTGVGPSSWQGNNTSSIPSSASSAIPGGIDISGQGPDSISGFLGGDGSAGVISPSASPMMDVNQSQPWINGGFGFQNSTGWSN